MRVILRSLGLLSILLGIGLLVMRCGGSDGGGGGDGPTDGGDTAGETDGGTTDADDPEAATVDPTVDGDKTSGAFSAAATTSQRLAVSEGTLAGTAVTIPAGALAVDVTISIEPEATGLVSETLATDLGVEATFSDWTGSVEFSAPSLRVEYELIPAPESAPTGGEGEE